MDLAPVILLFGYLLTVAIIVNYFTFRQTKRDLIQNGKQMIRSNETSFSFNCDENASSVIDE